MLQSKEITCIVCPKGCKVAVTVEGDTIKSIAGNQCKRGNEYAVCEFSNPERMLTTTVKIKGMERKMLPVRSSRAIAKTLLMDCMKEINKVEVGLPVMIGQVILSDILGTGVDIVASKDVIS
jgi:CxxC motif-containing protein